MFSRIFSWLIAVALTTVALSYGGLDFIERPLQEQRFKLNNSEADAGLVIVEIDPKSLREIGTWPWRRSLHALLIDRLTAANAGMVIFDVDFSLASSEAEDTAFEKALARRAGRTVLAAFRQWSDADQQYVDIGPLPQFARYSQIASANIFPESDGLLWRQPLVYDYKDGTIPSIASSMAGIAGVAIDVNDNSQDFWIDYGIDPATIQRFSFSDVAGGTVDPALLEGKIVLVGATAVELGDNVATPIYRSLPGVIVQMLAAQSLVKQRALQPLSKYQTFILLLLVSGGIALISWKQHPGRTLAAIFACDAVVFGGTVAIQSGYGILVPVAPVVVGTFLTGTFIFMARFRQLGLSMISERLARVRSQAMMASVAENAFDALITTDATGRIKTINHTAIKIFAVGNSDIKGFKMAKFYVPSLLTNKQSFDDVLQQAVSTGESLHILCKRNNGRAFHADLAVTYLNQEENDDLILLIRDINRRVKAEKLAQRRERDLVAARQKAELANRSKTEFLANMSHELKTPLNAVMGFADIMQQEMFGPLGSPNYLEYSRDIYDSGTRLLVTVTDVLDFARIEDGNLEARKDVFNLSDLVSRIVDMSRIRVEAAGLEMNVEVLDQDITFIGDERLIKQTLGSIISNSIKFNRQDGHINLALYKDEEGDIVLSITDSGIGIPADQIDACFKAFGQVDSSLQRHYEGAGLGLTLARIYVEIQNGILRIESVMDEGTTVTIKFPPAQLDQINLSLTG